MRRAVHDLVARPFLREVEGRPPHLSGPTLLPRAQRRALRDGLVERRVILNPNRVPPARGVWFDQLAYVWGTIIPPKRPSDLFRALVLECGVHPFLYCASGGGVLLATVSLIGQGSPAERSEKPVRTVLSEHLTGVDVAWEPVSSLRVLINHRYDRLIPG